MKENLLNSENKQMRNIIESECSKHQGYEKNMLNLTENPVLLKICQKCLQQEDIQTSNFQPIKELLEADANTIFKYYPPLTNKFKIPDQINILSAKASKKKETIQKNYEDFFAALTKELNNVRAQCQDEINEIDTRVNSVLELYQEMIQINKLKAALLGGDDSSQELQNIVSKNVKNKLKNSNDLQALLDNFEAYLKSYSDQKPKKYQNQILLSLKSIRFFSLSQVKKLENNKNVTDQTDNGIKPPLSSQSLSKDENNYNEKLRNKRFLTNDRLCYFMMGMIPAMLSMLILMFVCFKK